MAAITNLNKFKKAKASAEKDIKAANNRIEFGTQKHLKSKAKAQNLSELNRLEMAKLQKEEGT